MCFQECSKAVQSSHWHPVATDSIDWESPKKQDTGAYLLCNAEHLAMRILREGTDCICETSYGSTEAHGMCPIE